MGRQATKGIADIGNYRHELAKSLRHSPNPRHIKKLVSHLDDKEKAMLELIQTTDTVPLGDLDTFFSVLEKYGEIEKKLLVKHLKQFNKKYGEPRKIKKFKMNGLGEVVKEWEVWNVKALKRYNLDERKK